MLSVVKYKEAKAEGMSFGVPVGADMYHGYIVWLPQWSKGQGILRNGTDVVLVGDSVVEEVWTRFQNTLEIKKMRKERKIKV